MKVTPRTEEEIRTMMIWPDGEYSFEILNADEKISKSSGKDMLEILFKVYNNDGKSKLITDYLLDNDDPRMSFKLRHLCNCVGLLESYNKGQLEAIQFIGKSGKAILKTQKDKFGNYPDKNVIKDYIVEDFIDDDLIF